MTTTITPSQPTFIEDVPRGTASEKRRLLFGVDLYLLLTVTVLVAIGLMMVWSTTFYWAEPQSRLFAQQARNAGFGLMAMVAFTLIDYHFWRRFSIPLMGILVVALFGLLLLPDSERVFGAKRAYFDGAVQPSEVAGLVVVIYMSAWLSSKGRKIRSITYGLLPFAIMVGTVAGLIVLQPDIDPAAMILITTSVMFFLAGAPLAQLGLTLTVFAVVGVIVVSQLSYARDRWDSFLDLLRDPIQTQSDQAQNVIIAFLNGGLTGVGLGESKQKFEILQAPHTDSIFAVIGEEMGLIGCALVIGLFVLLLLRGFKISRDAPDAYGSLLAAGLTLSIALKALFNIAVMASVVPFVGVPLPFISFGGSSLISMMASVGLILSVSRAAARKPVSAPRLNESLSVSGAPLSREVSRGRSRAARSDESVSLPRSEAVRSETT